MTRKVVKEIGFIRMTAREIKDYEAFKRFQSAMTEEMWEAAISGEHERGCPAIADDESDFEHLDDAGECVCALRDGRKALDTLRQELQQTD